MIRNPATIQAVIFDMDGVLVDSEPRHERAFLDVVREIGYEDPGLCFSEFIGRSDRDLWRAFVAKMKPKETLEELLTLKRRRTIEILNEDQPLFPGVSELVRLLASKFKLGLASGSERAIIEAVLGFDNLRQYFSAVVSSADVARGKPEPDIFLKTASLLEVAPRDCWVIEDSKPGIAAGLAAGMRVLAIPNTHPAEELRAASHVVKTYDAIRQILYPDEAA